MVKPRKAIENFWLDGFFKEYRKSKEIEIKALKKFGCTYPNWNVLLIRCEFLRKTKKGWIQKEAHSGTTNKKVDYFKLFKIHPEIEKSSKRLFDNKHYSESVFNAFKTINNLVKEKSGQKSLDGKPLMLKVFSRNDPILKLNKLKTLSDKDEQEGFMHIFAGAIQGIRNPRGHDDLAQEEKYRALEHLILANLLCGKLKETKN